MKNNKNSNLQMKIIKFINKDTFKLYYLDFKVYLEVYYFQLFLQLQIKHKLIIK